VLYVGLFSIEKSMWIRFLWLSSAVFTESSEADLEPSELACYFLESGKLFS